MALWIFFQAWWLLPLFGLLVGWATNWLALKMIFNPKSGSTSDRGASRVCSFNARTRSRPTMVPWSPTM